MPDITVRPFGHASGGKAFLYTIKNSAGAELSVTNQGGCIVSVRVPDKNGILADIALGYNDAAAYELPDRYIAALIGRNSNRIGGAAFTLNGKSYKLAENNGRNNLHGGVKGFGTKLWKAEIRGEAVVVMSLFSADGEEGFPGNLNAEVAYSFDDNCTIRIEYRASCDADTICNMTNHCYFNLAGHDSGDILGLKLKLYSHAITPTDAELIPTGEIRNILNTPFDFLEYHTIGERIGEDDEQLVFAGGYDHNYVLDGKGFRKVAELLCEKNGRHMEVYTDLPGVQLYTGNFMNSEIPEGKDGAIYRKRNGVCLETQYYPDATGHPDFPSTLLKAGEDYHTVTEYRFDVK